MSKLTMIFLIAAAFLYAVWLVATRRRLGARQGGPGRRIFLMLTLFFMGWLGAPVHAADGRDSNIGIEATTDATRRMDIVTALRSAWEALLVANNGNRNAEERRQAIVDHPETLKKAVADGTISLGAAEVLQFAFSDMQAHLQRQLATCYMAMPAIAAPRNKMTTTIISLSRARNMNIELSALEEIREALMADIAEIHVLRISTNEHSQIMASGKEERQRKVADLFQAKKEGTIDETTFRSGLAEVTGEAQRQLLDGYFKLPDAAREADLREAVGILVDIARELPGVWIKQPWN